MTVDTISDALTRIGSIQQQLEQLQSGALLDSQFGIGGDSSSSATSGSTSSTDFADELAQAQQSSDTTDASDSTSAADLPGTTDTVGSTDSSELSALLGSAADGVLGSDTALTGSTTTATGGASLPSSAASELTSGQQQFASTLSADTGLNPSVVSAWLLAEESGSAAQSRQAAGNNDWLNIGYTDSGTYGSSDSVWSDPTTAANATAAWLKGENSISGYGTASSGIQSILSSVGQTPAAQIQAIQSSGWSSGGYPSLGSLYDQITA